LDNNNGMDEQIWVLFGLAAVMWISVTWLLIVIVALTLASANIVGFWKCQRGTSTHAMIISLPKCLILCSLIADAKEKIAGFLIQRL
jgi:hypothetical protein